MNLGERCRRDFPILSRIVTAPARYLDSGRVEPETGRGDETIQRLLRDQATPTCTARFHTLGEEATEQYEGARDAVRAFIGARSREESSSRADHRVDQPRGQAVGRTWPRATRSWSASSSTTRT